MRGQHLARVVALVAALGLAPVAAQPAEQDQDEVVAAAQAAVRPTVADVGAPVLTLPGDGALPDAAAVDTAIAQEWEDARLGPVSSRSIVVTDVLTGQRLVDRRGGEPLVPASTAKLLSAAAIMTTLDPQETFLTRAVAGSAPGEVVLVAAGDLLLAAGAGDPDAVVGRAGLADLAAQTAVALADAPGQDDAARASGAPAPVRVLLDTTYVEGPDVAPGWTDFWVDNGFAGRITMLGLAGDRALPYEPSPADPPMEAALAFREALAQEGVQLADQPVERTEIADPDAAQMLGEVRSAPVRDVLALALATSDNAMVEQLSRQAAVRGGTPVDQDAVNAWVLSQVADVYGLDTTDVRLTDTSGLSDGSAVPTRALSDVLVAGADGGHPGLQAVLRGLPVAGSTGTLFDRFLLDGGREGRGVVRAKTGSLPGVTTLAGTLVTADGRLLAFALSAGDVGDGAGGIEARAVIDGLLADLVGCGC